MYKHEIQIVERQIAQAQATLSDWLKKITQYQNHLEQITNQLNQIKNKLTK